MNSQPTSFWDEVRRGKLLPQEALANLAAQYQSWLAEQTAAAAGGKGSPRPNPATPADWMVEQRKLSQFQADVIASGFVERLNYAGYQLTDRRDSGIDELGTGFSVFKGVHRGTAHRVDMYFVDGSTSSSQASWDRVAALAERWHQLDLESCLPIWDVLVLSEYRLVVSERMDGLSLAAKVPAGHRLAPHKTLRYFHQMLELVRKLHESEFTYGRLNPGSFFIDQAGAMLLQPPHIGGRLCSAAAGEKGSTRSERKRKPDLDTGLEFVAPEVQADANLRLEASDIYSLGLLLHRLLYGKLPKRCEGQSQFRLAEPKQDESLAMLNDLIAQMLPAEPDQRVRLDEVIRRIKEIEVKVPEFKAKPFPAPQVQESAEAYRDWLQDWRPDGLLGAGEPEDAGDSGRISEADKLSIVDQSNTESSLAVAGSSVGDEFRQRRLLDAPMRRNLLFTSVITAAVLALVTAFTYIGVQIGKSMSPGIGTVGKVEAGSDAGQQAMPGPVDSGNTPQAGPEAGSQILVEDDGTLPWESPTVGDPIAYQLVPPSPRLIMTARMAELLGTEEGPRILQSLGEGAQQWVASLPQWVGFAPEEIESLSVSWHSDGQKYAFAYQVRLAEPQAPVDLFDRWPTADPVMTSSGVSFRQREDQWSFYYPESGDAIRIREFVAGPYELLMPVIESRGNTKLDGAIAQLAKSTDRLQLFNLLMVRSALDCEEARRMIPEPWQRLNRAIAIRQREELLGIVATAHLDNGLYLEANLQHSVDIKPDDVAAEIEDQLLALRDSTDQAMSSFRAAPYWESVRIRFDDMISMMTRNFRVGVEGSEVVANCWLPEVAGHNLIAGTELALFTAPDNIEQAPQPGNSSQPQVPATLSDLLKSKRDLFEANPPDLNVLLKEFKDGIVNDFGQLPFEFDIILIGDDLEAAGITRNQRPTQIDLQQQSIEQILTQIMFLANPEKNATGPSDPLCKLVWVVGPDPANPGADVILVTTREAAAQRGFELPAAFRSE